MKDGRAVHLIVLVVIVLSAALSRWFIPELWENRILTFATTGGFVTLYGVVFAVVETMRSRSASQQAKIAADKAGERVVAIYGVRDLGQCQSAIRSVLQDLDKDGWASTSALSRVVELYAGRHHEALRQDVGTQRALVAALQSHAASASGPLSARASTRLKGTLLEMLSDNSMVMSDSLSEVGA